MIRGAMLLVRHTILSEVEQMMAQLLGQSVPDHFDVVRFTVPTLDRMHLLLDRAVQQLLTTALTGTGEKLLNSVSLVIPVPKGTPSDPTFPFLQGVEQVIRTNRIDTTTGASEFDLAIVSHECDNPNCGMGSYRVASNWPARYLHTSEFDTVTEDYFLRYTAQSLGRRDIRTNFPAAISNEFILSEQKKLGLENEEAFIQKMSDEVKSREIGVLELNGIRFTRHDSLFYGPDALDELSLSDYALACGTVELVD